MVQAGNKKSAEKIFGNCKISGGIGDELRLKM